MTERTETFDLAELPAAITAELANYLRTREQLRGTRDIHTLRITGLTAKYRIIERNEAPAVAENPDAGRPERTHRDYGPHLPRSHDPGPPARVPDEDNAGQCILDWDPQP